MSDDARLLSWLLVMFLAAAACSSAEVAITTTTSSTISTTVASTAAPTTVTSTTQAPPEEEPSSTTATTTTTTLPPPPPLEALGLELVADGLDRPIYVTSPPGDPRLFIVERTARVLIVDPDKGILPEPFLDLRGVVKSVSIEQGLLGLAFHPGYAGNGRFFVYYTDPDDDSRVVEYRVGADPNRADPDSARLVLRIDQPAIRHNAGMLQFGPDGMLYGALGDGGAGGDEARDLGNPLGSIIRLDVDAEEPYAVPADNPFLDGNGAPELWAYGLRNPWRFWIDDVERLLYIADVGQEAWEEVDVVPLEPVGYDFGWPNVEGAHCFKESGCDPAAYVVPVLEYAHADSGCSITGGVVYRGAAIPEITGHYFYADWCQGWVRSFRYADGAAGDERDWSGDLGSFGQPNSFGVDAAGEMYIATWEGAVFKVIPIRAD